MLESDRKGNVLLWGILGVQKRSGTLAAKRCIVTVEEIVDDLKATENACVLPTWPERRLPLPWRASVLRHGTPSVITVSTRPWDAIAATANLHRLDQRIHPRQR